MDLELAIEQFFATGRRLQANPNLTAEDVLKEILAFYEDVRIDGADIDADEDMLLFQWGTTNALLVDEPIDFRTSDTRYDFEDTKRRYLDFTRQIFPAGDDEDADFDADAVQICMTLFYGPAQGNEEQSNQWIGRPKERVHGLRKFRSVPFVSEYLDLPVSRLVVTATYCG